MPGHLPENCEPRTRLVKDGSSQSWALSVFLNFLLIKNDFFAFFYEVNNLFLHLSYLKSPLPVKLT